MSSGLLRAPWSWSMDSIASLYTTVFTQIFSINYIMSNAGVKTRKKGGNRLKSCQGERQDHFMISCYAIRL